MKINGNSCVCCYSQYLFLKEKQTALKYSEDFSLWIAPREKCERGGFYRLCLNSFA